MRNRQEMDDVFFATRILVIGFFSKYLSACQISSKSVQKWRSTPKLGTCSKVKVHTKSDVIGVFLYREWLLSLAKTIHTESSQSHWPSQSLYYRGPKMLHFDKSGRIGTHRVSGQENFRWRKFWSNKKPSSISCRFRTLLFPSRVEAQTRLHI